MALKMEGSPFSKNKNFTRSRKLECKSSLPKYPSLQTKPYASLPAMEYLQSTPTTAHTFKAKFISVEDNLL